MKARLEKGVVKLYSKIPSKYRNGALNVAGGFHKMPDSVHRAQGFFDVVEPALNSATQKPGNIYFDATNNVFTYTVESKFASLNEYKRAKAIELNSRLKDKLFEIKELIDQASEADITLPAGVNVVRLNIRNSLRSGLIAIKNSQSKAAVTSSFDTAIAVLDNIPQVDIIDILLQTK